MLANERHFTADATHQLRTGITGIAMRFEILSMRHEPDVVTEAKAGLARPISSTPRSTSCSRPPATARRRSGCRSTSQRWSTTTPTEWQPRFSCGAPSPVGDHRLAGAAVSSARWASPGR